jgi:hypothetical protein
VAQQSRRDVLRANRELRAARALVAEGAGTVKNDISDILRKLDARDRTHAVLEAIAGHLLSKEGFAVD